ncbi:Forms passive diffusion pores that allow small molecular weight hydrophilic materials across the outer membrane [Vibrio sp. B1FLJ16]|uniref:hypothetical protein n=1 Tax=Vibrio sp. B1FLJ16 TaxID=2751178 RepID=UPI0015F51631|nr:hypothetical protein [Vibrio sp. B1FLJ16]CAD7807864.1 Forms passive diffusion pores that allow small molecular weight hydrophilic materials across the outer membrane [Vibrio sp. B1FLJ16]CAE6905668.1 Forms passive diffusion pores that allow small molecular weight hydrophilic materials across the outer membrane [Vibrio sp. B1FLJ16]
MRLQLRGVLLGALMLPSVSYSSTDMVEFRGFGSLSGAYSDSDTLGFRRDITQEGKTRQFSLSQDSLIGLQTDLQLSDAFKASVQVVGKDRVNNSLDELVTWANVSYDFNNAWNIRVGRIGSDLTLIGDVGNISYAYDWVRPPVEFYGAIPFYHFDGAEVLYRRSIEYGYFSAKVFYGRSGSTYKYESGESEFELAPFSGAALQYENGGFTYRAAYAWTKLDSAHNTGLDLRSFLEQNVDLSGMPETIAQYAIDRSPIQYYTTGFEYRNSSWKWLAEASYMYADLASILPSFSAYTGLVKRYDRVAFYGLFAHIQSTKSPESANSKLPEPYRTYMQSALDEVDIKQSTASLGMRWDVVPNIAIKGQWDHSWVAAGKSLLWDGKESVSDEQINVFTLGVSLIF